MTLHTMALIILWFFAIVLFAGLVTLTFIIGQMSVKDNPERALVFVKTGSHVAKPYKAKLYETAKQGYCYKFRHGLKFIFVPSAYDEVYFCGYRMLFISRENQIIPCPFHDDIKITNEDANNLIYELCASHVGADGMRALRGKMGMSLIIVALIAFIIGGLAVYGYNHMQEQKTQLQSQTQQIETPKPSLPQPVEVK